MDSWYRILRPPLLRPKKSIDDFISSTHITAKQFNQEIKAAFAFMQSHLIFETVLSLPSFPNPPQGQRISGLNCSKKYHVFFGYSCSRCENHTTAFSLAYSTTCLCKNYKDRPMILSITRYMLWT